MNRGRSVVRPLFCAVTPELCIQAAPGFRWRSTRATGPSAESIRLVGAAHERSELGIKPRRVLEEGRVADALIDRELSSLRHAGEFPVQGREQSIAHAPVASRRLQYKWQRQRAEEE